MRTALPSRAWPFAARYAPSRSRPCAAMAAAELSTGSWSLNGSAGRSSESPQPREAGSTRVPVRHTARRRLRDVEVRRGARRLEEARQDVDLRFLQWRRTRPRRACRGTRAARRSLQHPRQSARPGRERRVSLLARRAAVRAVGDVEDRLVRHAAPHVVGVAPAAEVHVVARVRVGVLDEALQQRDPAVALAHQHVPERWPTASDRSDAHRVGKQRVRTVERVDVAESLGQIGPPRRLDRAGDLQRELVERDFPLACRDAALRAASRSRLP